MTQMIEEIQNAVRLAGDEGRKLNIRGRGTWKGVYTDSSSAQDLSVAGYDGVREYVPGNLTITVRAGMSLEEITRVTGAENQWLPLDPFGSRDGTIGATVATCSYGPLLTGFGTPRDLVLGVEAILGTGDVVRAGGRVVKNVAGYDLSRLLTGSWGTLGVITELSLRLFAKQESEASVAIGIPAGRDAAEKLIRAVRASALYPWAMELVDAALATSLGLSGDLLVFRFGGNENIVRSQIKTVQALAQTQIVNDEFWTRLRNSQPGWSLRLSGLPSRFIEVWDSAAHLIETVGGGARTGSPERGVVRVFFPMETNSERLTAAVRRFAQDPASLNTRVVVEALPSLPPLTRFSSDQSAAKDLSAGIRKVFDPGNVLNSGLLPQ